MGDRKNKTVIIRRGYNGVHVELFRLGMPRATVCRLCVRSCVRACVQMRLSLITHDDDDTTIDGDVGRVEINLAAISTDSAAVKFSSGGHHVSTWAT